MQREKVALLAIAGIFGGMVLLSKKAGAQVLPETPGGRRSSYRDIPNWQLMNDAEQLAYMYDWANEQMLQWIEENVPEREQAKLNLSSDTRFWKYDPPGDGDGGPDMEPPQPSGSFDMPDDVEAAIGLVGLEFADAINTAVDMITPPVSFIDRTHAKVKQQIQQQRNKYIAQWKAARKKSKHSVSGAQPGYGPGQSPGWGGDAPEGVDYGGQAPGAPHGAQETPTGIAQGLGPGDSVGGFGGNGGVGPGGGTGDGPGPGGEAEGIGPAW